MTDAVMTRTLQAHHMLSEAAQTTQASFDAYADLAQHGWTSTTSSLGGVISAHGQCPVPLLIERLQLDTTEEKDVFVTSRPATHLEYRNIYNPSEGAIYALGRVAPQEPLRFQATGPLRAWSDVAFLEMRQHNGPSNKISHLKYIVQTRCDDPVTLAVVNWILSGFSDPWHDQIPPNADVGRVADRRIYPATSRYQRNGPALLSTPAGIRVMMLLAQHRDAQTGVGVKRVRSVEIVRDDRMETSADTARYDGPTLLFEIEDYTGELIGLTATKKKTGGKGTGTDVDKDSRDKKKNKDEDRGGRKSRKLLSGPGQASGQASAANAKRDTIPASDIINHLTERADSYPPAESSGGSSSGGAGRAAGSSGGVSGGGDVDPDVLAAASALMAISSDSGHDPYAVPPEGSSH